MSSDSFDIGGLFGAAQDQETKASAAAASVTVEPVSTFSTQLSTHQCSFGTQTQNKRDRGTAGRLYSKTKDAVRLIVEHNLPVREAYTIVNGQPPARATAAVLAAKAREYSLRAPEIQQLAHQVVKNVLRAKPIKATRTTVNKATGLSEEYTERIYPTHTNQLAAASMVMDRVDPVVRQNLNLNANLADVLPFSLDELG